MRVDAVSVLICTFNRAALLRETLTALQSISPPPACDVEIIVVDNNSADGTSRVIADAAARGPFRVVGLYERRQGKSFALNQGLAAARGDIIALTDDDVLPASDWLRRIVNRFREREVSFVFGKVLPRWAMAPPAELLTPEAQVIWGPLALVDYGDEPLEYTPAQTSQRLPVGANLAFSRQALLTLGGWRTDLGKVNNSLIAGEDHEMFCRLRRFDLYAGFYDPDITVRHYVPPYRLQRRYFRRWFYWLGKTFALMLDDLHPAVDMTRTRRIAGTPRFLWREAIIQLCRYLRTRYPGTPPLGALVEELRLLQHCGLIVQGWKQRHAQQPPEGWGTRVRALNQGPTTEPLQT